MQFRNKSDDARELTLNGVQLVTVPRGETIDATLEQAAGLLLQCGPDGAWEPSDDEATAAVTAATTEPTPELDAPKTRLVKPRTPKEQ